MKTYIGLIGQPAAGKGTVAEILTRLVQSIGGQTVVFRFSDPLNAAMDALGIPKERQAQQDFSLMVRTRFGMDLLSKQVHRLALEAEAEFVVIDGIRKAVDLEMLRSLPNSYAVYVTAPPELRYAFLGARKRPGEEQKSWEEFCREDQAETERESRALGEQADITIVNDVSDSSFEHITRQVLSFLDSIV